MAGDPQGRREIRAAAEAVEIRVGAPAAKAARRGLALTHVGEWPGRALGNRIGRAPGNGIGRAANMSETEEI